MMRWHGLRACSLWRRHQMQWQWRTTAVLRLQRLQEQAVQQAAAVPRSSGGGGSPKALQACRLHLRLPWGRSALKSWCSGWRPPAIRFGGRWLCGCVPESFQCWWSRCPACLPASGQRCPCCLPAPLSLCSLPCGRRFVRRSLCAWSCPPRPHPSCSPTLPPATAPSAPSTRSSK